MIILTQGQTAMVTFVMVDSNCNEVAGLGGALTIQVSKAGGAFAGSAGAQAEISNGWYSYTFTAAELDTVGPVTLRVTGAGAVQQNLMYFVRSATVGCVEFTYTVTDSSTGLPIEGVEVWVTTDVLGNNPVWYGTTDALGVARDGGDNPPCLDAGQYFFWKQRAGYEPDEVPDTEIVS